MAQVLVEEARDLAFQMQGRHYRVSKGSYRIQNSSEQELRNLGLPVGPVELGAIICLSIDI